MLQPEVPAVGSGVTGHGIETGRGFYDWGGKDPDQVKAKAVRKRDALLAYLKRQK